MAQEEAVVKEAPAQKSETKKTAEDGTAKKAKPADKKTAEKGPDKKEETKQPPAESADKKPAAKERRKNGPPKAPPRQKMPRDDTKKETLNNQANHKHAEEPEEPAAPAANHSAPVEKSTPGAAAPKEDENIVVEEDIDINIDEILADEGISKPPAETEKVNYVEFNTARYSRRNQYKSDADTR